MGYDKQVITDFLIKNNFDNLLANQVECVYQSDYAVTDEKIRALYTDSLATCIALYAICDDFAFLAHIQLGSLSDDFEQEKIGNRYYVTWCNTITELLTQINIRVVRKIKMWYNLSARYERRKLESSLYGVTLIHI